MMLRIALMNSNTIVETAGAVEAADLRLFTGSLARAASVNQVRHLGLDCK
jgi:hypothetical protein